MKITAPEEKILRYLEKKVSPARIRRRPRTEGSDGGQLPDFPAIEREIRSELTNAGGSY